MKVISEQIDKTQKLITGLKNKLELVKGKGLDEKFIAQLESDTAFVKSNNLESERLKSEAKLKTKQANIRLIEVKAQVKKAKKIIKQDFTQSRWKEFGIFDVR